MRSAMGQDGDRCLVKRSSEGSLGLGDSIVLDHCDQSLWPCVEDVPKLKSISLRLPPGIELI